MSLSAGPWPISEVKKDTDLLRSCVTVSKDNPLQLRDHRLARRDTDCARVGIREQADFLRRIHEARAIEGETLALLHTLRVRRNDRCGWSLIEHALVESGDLVLRHGVEL